MGDLIPLRSIVPIVLPRAAEQYLHQFCFEYGYVREREVPKWILDHFASVFEFQGWKAEHPRDGTMKVLYRWTPIIVAAISVLSVNPIGLGFIPGLLGHRHQLERTEG